MPHLVTLHMSSPALNLVVVSSSSNKSATHFLSTVASPIQPEHIAAIKESQAHKQIQTEEHRQSASSQQVVLLSPVSSTNPILVYSFYEQALAQRDSESSNKLEIQNVTRHPCTSREED